MGGLKGNITGFEENLSLSLFLFSFFHSCDTDTKEDVKLEEHLTPFDNIAFK